ncbi:MAG: hypothetical protein FJ276_36650 [Planctomycetes bacterium]|nr:hypothetical protein [Planctomycetota bacterium]
MRQLHGTRRRTNKHVGPADHQFPQHPVLLVGQRRADLPPVGGSKHTASGTGPLSTSTARVTYTASWFDGANRQTDTANYGTNGGSSFSRPSSPPSRSDTVLVTSTEYLCPCQLPDTELCCLF